MAGYESANGTITTDDNILAVSVTASILSLLSFCLLSFYGYFLFLLIRTKQWNTNGFWVFIIQLGLVDIVSGLLWLLSFLSSVFQTFLISQHFHTVLSHLSCALWIYDLQTLLAIALSRFYSVHMPFASKIFHSSPKKPLFLLLALQTISTILVIVNQSSDDFGLYFLPTKMHYTLAKGAKSELQMLYALYPLFVAGLSLVLYSFSSFKLRKLISGGNSQIDIAALKNTLMIGIWSTVSLTVTSVVYLMGGWGFVGLWFAALQAVATTNVFFATPFICIHCSSNIRALLTFGNAQVAHGSTQAQQRNVANSAV